MDDPGPWASFDPLRLISPQEFAWLTGLVFRRVTISPSRSGGWNVIVRAWRSNEPVYAMTEAKDPADGARMLLWALAGKDAKDLWRFDRFAK